MDTGRPKSGDCTGTLAAVVSVDTFFGTRRREAAVTRLPDLSSGLNHAGRGSRSSPPALPAKRLDLPLQLVTEPFDPGFRLVEPPQEGLQTALDRVQTPLHRVRKNIPQVA
jgi:hypothetical protein